ncbi:putative phosphatase (plasmid) [Variovorax sp. PBL-H6]|nr:putative phosphatase [Variovorax sp. PBL-H6]VTU44518.1 putative phosphatase [Variovorax sp. SRS16]VTU44561.1 putative phosphatase [Variovorax sp. PBL-E5]
MEKLVAVARRCGVEIPAAAFSTVQRFTVPGAEGAPVEAQMPLYGAGDKNVYHWLVSIRPEIKQVLSLDQWLALLLDHYLAQAHRIEARGSIPEVVRQLESAKALQGVVTSGIPAQVTANLKAVGPASEHFAFVLTADDVTQSKPHPEGYLRGAALLADKFLSTKSGPLVIVAVEDSPPGVRAALDAGLLCIQFLLPGQAPEVLTPHEAGRFRAATSAEEVLAAIHAFAEQQRGR